MNHKEELHQALVAAEAVLDDLPHHGVLLVTEIGDYGLQIAISDRVNPATVRASLRGAADALDGKQRPFLADVQAALKARGWEVSKAGYNHPKAPDEDLELVEAMFAQTVIEIAATSPLVDERQRIGCPACAPSRHGPEEGPGCEQCEGQGWVWVVPDGPQ